MNKTTVSSILAHIKESFRANKSIYISLFVVTLLLVVLNELNIVHEIAKFAIIPIVAALQLGRFLKQKNA